MVLLREILEASQFSGLLRSSQRSLTALPSVLHSMFPLLSLSVPKCSTNHRTMHRLVSAERLQYILDGGIVSIKMLLGSPVKASCPNVLGLADAGR